MRKLSVSFFAAIALALSACSGNPELSEASEFGDIIESFTSSNLTASGALEINFTKVLGQVDSLEGEPARHLLSFKPHLNGKALWENDGMTLRFIPDKNSIKPDQVYFCTLKTSLLESGRKDFVFRFKGTRPSCRICLTGVRPDPGQELTDSISINGRITFSEPLECENPEEFVICKNVKTPYTVQAVKNSDTEYDFKISGILKTDEPYDVPVSFDSGKIGLEPSELLKAHIPSRNCFTVTGVHFSDGKAPYLRVDFSDALDPAQSLDGLIEVSTTDDISIEKGFSSVKVHLPETFEKGTLEISSYLRNVRKEPLQDDICRDIDRGELFPQVEIPISGTILPDMGRLVLPFKAANLRAVDVSVVRIYSDNILSFLQENEISQGWGIRRAGRLIYRKTARLDDNAALDLHCWNNFSIDLSDVFKNDKGAIYQIRLSFKKEYSLYGQKDYVCGIGIPEEKEVSTEDEAIWDIPQSYYYYGEDLFDWEEYDWRETDDPTKPSYYMLDEHFPTYNLAASDIGLIAKSSDKGMLWTSASNILTSEPMRGVKVTAYNYQLREIGSGVTSDKGFADFPVSGSPFIVTASHKGFTTYLKMIFGKENSMSRFDVGGQKIVKGMKGYAYGERGVWRPGDTLHVTFLLYDKNNRIPQNYPVEMTLHTPQGQFYNRYVLNTGKDGFYCFTIPTKDSDPTGIWTADFDAGGSKFTRKLRLETVKPNRLKIEFDFPAGILHPGDGNEVAVSSSWLTGPPASGLESDISITFVRESKPFRDYGDFIFDNPLSSFDSYEYLSGNFTLDSLGKAMESMNLYDISSSPGMLSSNVCCRVAEPGGGTSFTVKSYPFSPFASYAGVKIGESDYETDTDLNFPVVNLDQLGKKVPHPDLYYKIYRIGWSWWWESGLKDLDSYINSDNAKIVAEGNVSGSSVHFRVNYPEWGRYLLLVSDRSSGHITGGVFCVDWPLWRGHSDKSDPSAITMLSFTTDKDSYNVGETVRLYIPAAKDGHALVSLENGSGVISRTWVETEADAETVHEIKVTKDMVPNFYIHISLLQPHCNTSNDLPIRMYGVRNVTVSDSMLHLEPEITAPDEVEPGRDFIVKIKEKNNRPMTYTLAVVDEGLLDLTSFKTPDPFSAMNSREALGVRTWDMYDDVIGSYTGSWSKVLSAGGDENLKKGSVKDNRFKPVSLFYGPFTVERGTATHKIKLPMYLGRVKLMLVAGRDGSFGNAEKSISVRSPLMIVSALPASLSRGEIVKLPVNVFATEDGMGPVNVQVKVSGPVKLESSGSSMLNFKKTGDAMAFFTLSTDKVRDGIAEITVCAKNAKYSAEEKISIAVRNTDNPAVSITDKTLAPGSDETLSWTPFKAGSKESVNVEISSFPSISFDDAFAFVSSYEHACTEQLSSMGLFLLNCGSFLPSNRQEDVNSRLEGIISDLYGRQLSSGGFSYWNNGSEVDQWATSMAGQVLVQARAAGFPVSAAVLRKWLDYQKKMAKSFKKAEDGNLSDLQQAYRLYALALAASPDFPSMNRLKESHSLSPQARMRLAAAYAVCGKLPQARDVLSVPSEPVNIVDWRYTFYDPERDGAMALETLALVGEKAQALKLASEIAENFSSAKCGTQTLAFVSVAIKRLCELVGNERPSYSVDGTDMSSVHYSSSLDCSKGKVSVKNNGAGEITVRLVERKMPPAGTFTEPSSNET